DRKMLSFSAGDTRKPEFVAINPRHRVPTITDGDFTLYESNAIVEYLDEAYPGRGQPLFPGDAKNRALIRRLISEVDNYFDEAVDDGVRGHGDDSRRMRVWRHRSGEARAAFDEPQSGLRLAGRADRNAVARAPVPRPRRAVARRRRQPGGSRRSGFVTARRF